MQNLEQVLQSVSQVNVIGNKLKAEDFVAIDLSVDNLELPPYNLAETQQYISNIIKASDGKVAYGGYNEHRNLYRDSDIFQNDDADQERDIHIGLDIWISAGTSVLAALDGSVHSFNYNTGKGNYGPTVILQHKVKDVTFYTLYGHLSSDSIEDIEIGDTFRGGEKIGALGEPHENGGYPPHLHFQIINDIADHFGDYPGVCSKNDLDCYLKNCPDPNLLLKLKK